MAAPSPPAAPRSGPALVLRVALIVLAASALALVGLAQWNPWQLTALFPVARVPVTLAVVFLSAALLASAVLLSLPRIARAAATLALAVTTVTALCLGIPVVVLNDPFGGASPTTMAVSPGGGYEVVGSAVDGQVNGAIRLYVRSRDGLLSRQAATPIAQCPFNLFVEGTPPESVHFTSETTLALPLEGGGVSIVVGFDPDTLRPERTLAMCDRS